MVNDEAHIRRVNTTVTLGSWLKPAFVVLAGAFLRLWNLTALGLEHDEVANWLIDRSILAGNHGIYFQEAYGHEAGFHYLQTLFIALIGDNALALRLPAAFLGIILIAVSYQFVRVLYNRKVALIAAAIVAVTFFPIFYSRLALRAIMLPVFSGAAGYFYWRGCKSQVASRNYMFAAGVLAGLAAYTYMASRVIPIFFALLLIYDLVFHREKLRFTFYVLLLYSIIAAPLFIYLSLNPSAEFRISEINYPLEQLKQFNLRPVLDNAWHILGVWGWHGDPLWRQNVAGRPIFTAPIALFFYAGILFMLWRRQRRDIFVLLWLATATIPSLVTDDAPSTIRMINMLPLLGVPFALAFSWVGHVLVANQRSSGMFRDLQIPKHVQSDRMMRTSWSLFLLGLLVYATAQHTVMMQRIWPQSEEVQFVWQQSLTSMAAWLDGQTTLQEVTILGWTPDTMDAPTMELALQRDDLDLRFAGRDGDHVEAIVLPADESAAILQPRTPLLPLHPALQPFLANEQQYDDFMRWEGVRPNSLIPASTQFDNQWQLIGNTTCETTTGICHFATVWRVTGSGDVAQSVFVHLLDVAGEIVSQSDVQLNGRASWRVDDLAIVAHTVDLTDVVAVRTGIYHPTPPFIRLLTPTGQDSATITLFAP